jgi:gluconolactonase
MKLTKFLITLPLLCFGLAFGQIKSLDDIIQPGAKVEKLADGFLFTEGPVADAKGNVYFTDQPNDRIMIWEPFREAYHFYEAQWPFKWNGIR